MHKQFDTIENATVAQAFWVLRQFIDWLQTWDPTNDAHANVQCSRTLLVLCIGDHPVWNSNENTEDQLNLQWVLQNYEREVRDRIDAIDRWKDDNTTFTGDD